MSTVMCFCRRYKINPENATFVKNGVPMCCAATCQKVKEHREARELRRVPFADDNDYIPEPYAKSAHARNQDV